MDEPNPFEVQSSQETNEESGAGYQSFLEYQDINFHETSSSQLQNPFSSQHQQDIDSSPKIQDNSFTLRASTSIEQSQQLLNSSPLPIPSAIPSIEIVEWVPDEYSESCEYCRSVFTFINRRHHCRACGHLFCSGCILKISLPQSLGFTASQRTCLKCSYKVMKLRNVDFVATAVDPDGVTLGQKIGAKMNDFVSRYCGMYEGGTFERNAGYLLSASVLTSKYHTEVKKLEIPSYDGYILGAKAFIPDGEGPFPVLVYFMSGGFVIGSLDSSGLASLCQEFSVRVQCIVIAVAFRLAPENKYPVQWEDCYAATNWIYEQGPTYISMMELHPKLAVCGESTGGLLAASVCQMARDRDGPPICYQLLVNPLVNTYDLPMDQLSTSYGISGHLLKWYFSQVFTDPLGEAQAEYASPLLTTHFHDLPNTKIITAGHDPLKMAAEEYAYKIREAGGRSSVTRYENSLHGFLGSNDILGESSEAILECVVCLREVFAFGEFEPRK